jgi:hypothetical protein
MDGTGPAGPGAQPGDEVIIPLRLAVTIDGSADPGRRGRVDAPGRVLRIWALLNSAHDELGQANLPTAAVARLKRQFAVLTAELEQSVSPALAGELRHLVGGEEGATATADELRMMYASLLGWTSGLVIGMLNQLDAASSKVAGSNPGPRLVVGR